MEFNNELSKFNSIIILFVSFNVNITPHVFVLNM